MNELFLRALHCENSERPPIWLMRQAGRYMPEYRAIREKYAFLDMCHQPELAAEITLLPIKTFGFDAAIIFSDILVIAEALDMGLRFEENVGPIIERPLKTDADVDYLPKPDIKDKLGYVFAAIRLAVKQLNVPLIGFCGAPFTVASYMIEGGTSKDFKKTKMWMLKNPKKFHQILERITDLTIDYLNYQVDAGAQALQIFDSWAHVLAFRQFQEFSAAYQERILAGLKKKVPVILFSRGSSVFAEQMSAIGPQGISLDWNANLTGIRKLVGPNIALQGNLDPDILFAPQPIVKEETLNLLRSMRGDRGYIFNLGHGIKPETPVESVRTLVETVHNFIP